MRSLLPALLLSACTTAEVVPDVIDDNLGVCSGGPEVSGVVTELLFVRPDADGFSDGFDLDGDATGQGGSAGCNVPDNTSPDGTLGIDNSFAKLLPALELTEAQAVEMIIQETIRTGELLLVPVLSGLDDLVNDDCVTLGLVRGEGEPRLSAAGDLTTYQTFIASSRVELGQSSLTDGTAEVRHFTYTLPFQFLTADFNLTLHDAALRVTMHEDGSFDGVLAGGVVAQELVDVVTAQGISRDVVNLLETLLGTVTDLAPDENGVCQQLSISLKFRGVPAFVFPDDGA